MTEEQLAILASAMLQLNRGFIEVVRHVVEQEAEIGAILSMLERKGIAPEGQLDRASDETVRRSKDGYSDPPLRRCRRLTRRQSNGGTRSAA